MSNKLTFGSFDQLSNFFQDTKSTTGIDLLPNYDSGYDHNEEEHELTASEKMDQIMNSLDSSSSDCESENEPKVDIIVSEKAIVSETKTCPHCGKEFTTKIASKRFCSEECRIAFNAKKRLKGTKFHKVCKVCGRHFDTSNHMQTHCEMCVQHKTKATPKAKSKKSVNHVTIEMKKAMRINCVAKGIGKDKVYTITSNCMHCGKPFTYDSKTFSYNTFKSFCSGKCEYAFRMGKKVK